MPGYSCKWNDLQKLLDQPEVTLDNLESYLDYAKSELKGYDGETDELKLENNDTNRPDLWSAEGTARQIACCCFGRKREYDFFELEPEENHVIRVDAALASVRPFIAGFSVTGLTVDQPLLDQIIQTQEKLCDNYGKFRELIAIGVYDASEILFPVQYRGANPAGVSFAPLGFEEVMTLEEILEKHPKGVQYAPLVKGNSLYPLIADSRGNVLSFPPVINSNDLGCVKEGHDHLFVEVTGKDRDSVLLAANIFACNLADRGGRIHPFRVEYDGGSAVTPGLFGESTEVELSYIESVAGEKTDGAQAVRLLENMGHQAVVDGAGRKITCTPPPYRRDILHAVDLVEDFCIARGYNFFEPEMPDSFTVGSEAPVVKRAALMRDLLIGMEFQEVMTYILTSSANQREKMCDGSAVVEIDNVMTETFGVVRARLLPILLEIESKNPRVEYPHRIFETGEVALPDPGSVEGTKTVHRLSALIAHSGANFSQVHSVLQALFYYTGISYRLEEAVHPSFIEGRCGRIVIGDESAGLIGEIHPQVLENWGIVVPCSAFELDLDMSVGEGKSEGAAGAGPKK